jgi:hypothetical protein
METLMETVRGRFKALAPAVDFCSLRLVEESSEYLSVRQDVLQPLSTSTDRGAMITVIDGGGYGYAATSDLSTAGLKRALDLARQWAEVSAGQAVADYSGIIEGARRQAAGKNAGQGAGRDAAAIRGRYASPGGSPIPLRSRREIIELLLADRLGMK